MKRLRYVIETLRLKNITLMGYTVDEVNITIEKSSDLKLLCVKITTLYYIKFCITYF